MQTNNHKWLLLTPACLSILLAFTISARPTRAQQNPTPIVITLTPGGSPTVVPSPTSDGAFPPDRFEPNNEPGLATPIGWQTEAELTLAGTDVDYYTAYLKTGQMVRLATTVYGSLDTRLKLFWNGQLVAENDDRSPVDVGSLVTWTAAADGWFVVLVEKVTAANGRYDLEAALVAPTATPTAPPTLTPTPTPTPSPSQRQWCSPIRPSPMTRQKQRTPSRQACRPPTRWVLATLITSASLPRRATGTAAKR